MEETAESAELVERVAALDIGKAALMACIRVPHEDKPRPPLPGSAQNTPPPPAGSLDAWPTTCAARA